MTLHNQIIKNIVNGFVDISSYDSVSISKDINYIDDDNLNCLIMQNQMVLK